MEDGLSYLSFLAPGLIMMAMAQNAFSNTSSSLVISKIQETSLIYSCRRSPQVKF